MDNPLTHQGSEVYQPNQPINLCYDTFGPAAAFMRGLFEYIYTAEGLRLVPHIPPGLTMLEQLDSVRFGSKQVFLSSIGSGELKEVRVNGKRWRHKNDSVLLAYGKTPEIARVQFILGSGEIPAPARSPKGSKPAGVQVAIPKQTSTADVANLQQKAERLRNFLDKAHLAKLSETYEAAHARLAIQCIENGRLRRTLQDAGVIQPLGEKSQAAADQLYVDTAVKLCTGFERLLESYEKSPEKPRRELYDLWLRSNSR
jgi:hypothetical protein